MDNLITQDILFTAALMEQHEPPEPEPKKIPVKLVDPRGHWKKKFSKKPVTVMVDPRRFKK